MILSTSVLSPYRILHFGKNGLQLEISVLISVLFAVQSGPEIIKLVSCSAQLSINFFLLINVKMPTIVGILTLMSRKNSFLGLSETKNAEFLDSFILIRI